MHNQAELTGYSAPEMDHTPDPNRPMATVWMTDTLLDETVRVWSGIYGRTIGRDEAVEILRNIKNFFEWVNTIVE